MMMFGYKAFNEDLTDRYGNQYEKYITYETDEDIKWRKKGYHFCKNLEDTLRFYDFIEQTPIITVVKCDGNMDAYSDEYYGYYDMYACSKIQIINVLSRSDILEYMIKTNNSNRIERFVSGFKLNKDEIEMFKGISERVNDALEFYQLGHLDVYSKKKIK